MADDNLLTKATCEYARRYPVMTEDAAGSGRKWDGKTTAVWSDAAIWVSGGGETVEWRQRENPESWSNEADMDNANEPVPIEYELSLPPGETMKMVGHRDDGGEIWQAVKLDVKPASDKPTSDPKPEFAHRAPEVWARIRSLSAS